MMDADLYDLLSAWRGGDLDESRHAELLDKLRRDEEFRRAFVEETRLLGMLKAGQSRKPRWLLLEDELGSRPDTQEQRTIRSFADTLSSRSIGLWKWGALAAAAVLIGLLLFVPRQRRGLSPQSASSAFVAVVVRMDGAEWEASNGAVVSEGSTLPAGSLRLRAGRATLTLFNGVMLSVQGPADLNLMSVERVFCREGKVRARVPHSAGSFAVLSPGSAVVDLGTEFGLNVAADGKAQCMVFQGAAEVSVLNGDGHTLRSQVLNEKMAADIDPSAGRIRDAVPQPEQFVAAPEMIPPTLLLDAAYPDAVRQARPWGYWRFERQGDGHIANEIADRPTLRCVGPVELAGAAGENHSAVFGPTPAEQCLLLDDSWPLQQATGYAVELWALSEEFNASTLISLTSRADEPEQKHLLLLEMTGQSHHLVHEPCRVRFLDRWPAGDSGGVNVFSRHTYIPYRWHHLVAQKVGERLELYMDGELEGSVQADADEATTLCRLLVGRLKTEPQPNDYQRRPFVGRLDELAVYDRPLSSQDIRWHYELGTGR